MASELLVNKITPESGTTLTLGDSGDTISFASGVLPALESLTITGDLTVDTTTLKVDSTNNRVGIGTASPSYDLQISKDGGGASVRLDVVNTGVAANDDTLLSFVGGSNNNENIIYFGDTDDSNVGIIRYNHASDHMSFTTNASEAMRIDSSGNVLVGKTTAINPALTEGIHFAQNGAGYFTKDGGHALQVGRLTNDGDFVSFRKDGTIVGQIGTKSTELTVGNASTGLLFDDDAGYILPWNLSTNAGGDNTIDLGNTNQRYKDLYMSGNIYLGGTGAANALDDYEEGTWTPVASDATSGGNNPASIVTSGAYTKIGRMVRATFVLQNINSSGMTSGNALYVQGLPFTTSSSSPAQISDNAVKCDQITFTGYVVVGPSAGNSYFLFRDVRSGSTDVSLLVSAITSSTADITGSLTYFTD